MDPNSLPQVYFIEEGGSKYVLQIRLPDDYAKVAPKLPKKGVLSALEAKAAEIENELKIKAGFEWDDEKGLTCVKLGDEGETRITLDGLVYLPQKVDTPEKALALLGIALEYLRWVAYFSKKM